MRYHLECVQCGEVHPSGYGKQVCGKCGGILDVRYEGRISVAKGTGSFWDYEKALPDGRYRHASRTRGLSVIHPKAIPDDVFSVCRRLRQAGFEAYLVGGSVRDLLAGRSVGDFDVATSARPEEILRVFGARFSIPTGLQHGTVTVLVGEPPRQVEVTTFRGEARISTADTFGRDLWRELWPRIFRAGTSP